MKKLFSTLFLVFIISLAVYFIYLFRLIEKDNEDLTGEHETKTSTNILLEDGKKEKRNYSSGEISFVFAGDVMLGRLVGKRHQTDNFVTMMEKFDHELFADVDFAWLNLEGPISEKTVEQIMKPNDFNFLFSKESLVFLKDLGVNVVGLANNHTINNGHDGLRLTESLLEQQGVDWHGHPTKVDDTSVYRIKKQGVKVSLIAVHTLYDGSGDGVEEVIQTEKENGAFVIVLPHWGPEYELTRSPQQESYARAWSDRGADMIIGAHPHVVQDAQIIVNKDKRETLVLYSLGNFIFDQTFSEETQLGLIMRMVIRADDEVVIDLHPVESVNLQPQNASPEKQSRIIERICMNISDHCDIRRGRIRY